MIFKQKPGGKHPARKRFAAYQKRIVLLNKYSDIFIKIAAIFEIPSSGMLREFYVHLMGCDEIGLFSPSRCIARTNIT